MFIASIKLIWDHSDLCHSGFSIADDLYYRRTGYKSLVPRMVRRVVCLNMNTKFACPSFEEPRN